MSPGTAIWVQPADRCGTIEAVNGDMLAVVFFDGYDPAGRLLYSRAAVRRADVETDRPDWRGRRTR